MHQHNQAGYSLLELMVVLAIMTIVVAMAAPFASNAVDNFSLTSDARLVASKLREWRDEAADRQTDLVLNRIDGNPVTLQVSSGDTLKLSTGTDVRLSVRDQTAPLIIGWDGSLSSSLLLTKGGRKVRIGLSDQSQAISAVEIP